MKKYLVSTISREKYPFDRLEEFAENGESLEVKIENLNRGKVKEGPTIWQRFRDFLPEEILTGQRILAKGGFFVEPSSATSLLAVKKLCKAGKIKRHESVVLMLTGSGLKDAEVFKYHPFEIINSNISTIENDLKKILS